MSREIKNNSSQNSKAKLNNNSIPSRKTLVVQEISHAMALVSCPKCCSSIAIVADNQENEKCRCWCCDFRFEAKVNEIEISYREVVSIEDDKGDNHA